MAYPLCRACRASSIKFPLKGSLSGRIRYYIYSTPALNPHSFPPEDLCSPFYSEEIQFRSTICTSSIPEPPMDSHYSHGKHSQGEASPTSDRGVSDFIRTAASSYFPAEESEGGAASSPPTHHQSSSFNSGEKMKPSGRQPSGGQAAASAKVLLDAAVAKLHKTQAEGGGEGEEIDNAKLAAAAADVLEAAKHYGKMEGTSYGKYVDMAGGYLQKFGQKQGSGNVAVHDNYARPPSSHSTQHAQEDDSYGRPHGSGNAAAHDSYARPPSSHSTPHAQEDDDYVRPASSHSASYAEEKEEENQYLKYFKKAEEFLNKN